MIQMRVTRRAATVPLEKPVTRERTKGTWWVMPTPAAKSMTVP